ncbi:tetratricopeptide repeat protein [uncultured Dialister sp.]|jgi:TPR repeat protein|uniref:tetratricopeptide repeat protein n=1 Tax=uncultured Dialister sp. TaxID=278064 RepID=UPI0025D890C4|nr:hypothetical protein [uncultured Dialister sp.]
MTDMENAETLFQEYKMKEAYPLFEKMASEGNSRAMYFMALFHQYYMGCAPWSPKKAIGWALKGARLGDGLCGLFCLLHFNELSHEEYHEITDRREEWISLAEKDGSLYAMEALGCYEMVNAQSEEEVDRAFHLLEEAALKNYWKAWNDLGQFHDSHVKDNPPLVQKKADNRKAIDCYRKALEAGYPDAMNRLAYFYYTGVGVPQDKKEAVSLFRKAFAKGHLRAGTALGLLYLYDGNDRDKKEGFRMTRKAADAGDPVAMGNVGNCYYYGNGTKKDRRLAKEYYQKASDLGMDSSTTQLGAIYHEEGNDKKAFALFQKAADRNFPEAMGWLAACYQYGYGTEKSTEAALEWLEKAAAFGSEDAKTALRYLQEELKEAEKK